MKTITKKGFIPAILIVVFALVITMFGCASEPKQEAETTLEPTTATVTVDIKAEGWKADSTPVIVHFVNDDIDFYHAFAYGDNGKDFECDAGDYTIEVISPINADGSIYVVPDEAPFTAEDEGTLLVELAPATDVKAEDLTAILTSLKDACAKGDATLAGDAGDKVVATYTANAEANASADTEAIKEVAEEATQAAKENTQPVAPKAPAASSKPVQSNTQAPASSASQSVSDQGAAEQPSAPAVETPKQETTAPAVPAQPSTPQEPAIQEKPSGHVHDYQPVYYMQQVEVGSQVVCSCGLTFSSDAAWGAHNKANLLNGGKGCSYSVQPVYEARQAVACYQCSCGAVQ